MAIQSSVNGVKNLQRTNKLYQSESILKNIQIFSRRMMHKKVRYLIPKTPSCYIQFFCGI